jgi:hypothetical protein
MNLHFFSEGRTYLKNEIPSFFIENKYFTKNNSNKFTLKVCGIVNFKNDTYVFFPKGYSHENYEINENEETAGLLFQAILKYKDTNRLKSEEWDWLGDDNTDIKHLDTITWLITDYLANGLHNVFERVCEEDGKGRIEWARTIKSKIPFIRDNKFSYLNLLTTRNNISFNHIVTKIHEKIILECIDDFGWLFKIGSSGKKVDLEISKEKQILILEKKLKETFVWHEVMLIKSLISYLKETINEDSDFILVTLYFNLIWEKMLQFIFNHDESINKIIPKPYWKFEGKQNHRYTNQIPDILVKWDNDLIILDAKYYSIEIEDINKFPGWESVLKQLYYSLSFKDLELDGKKIKDIKNIFLMSQSLLKDDFKDNFRYIGFTGVEGKDELGIVHAFSLDIKTVLNDYVKNKDNMKMFKKLLKDVDNKTLK